MQDLMNDKNNFKKFFIILVEPKYSGNIGAVARVMKNFDFKNLILVNPTELDEICYARAMHATDILEKAKVYANFNDAIKNIDFLIATSSIESKTDKKHLRNPMNLKDFSEKVFEVDGKIGIVFGREDFGLFNEEIAKCDIMIRIPSSESYMSFNLSHAVCLILYSLFLEKDFNPRKRRDIQKLEKEKLFEFFSRILDLINYPEHKKENTKIMFKRIMGRAMPSTWEFHTLMGVFSRILERKN